MNEIIRAMEERRSIRSFKPDMPRKEEIDQIIEAGLYAPSGMGRQSAIVLAVMDTRQRDKLAQINASIMGRSKKRKVKKTALKNRKSLVKQGFLA